jgi:hypothetical protein
MWMEHKYNEAEDFITLLETGKLRKCLLPNTSEDYTGYQEKRELQRYKRFLQSFAYDDIKGCEVSMYNGD